MSEKYEEVDVPFVDGWSHGAAQSGIWLLRGTRTRSSDLRRPWSQVRTIRDSKK